MQLTCRFDPWVGKIPWRRRWQPTPVFLPEASHGQRSLVGYLQSIGLPKLDTTERLSSHSGCRATRKSPREGHGPSNALCKRETQEMWSENCTPSQRFPRSQCPVRNLRASTQAPTAEGVIPTERLLEGPPPSILELGSGIPPTRTPTSSCAGCPCAFGGWARRMAGYKPVK